jgi:hypothetical protein
MYGKRVYQELTYKLPVFVDGVVRAEGKLLHLWIAR